MPFCKVVREGEERCEGNMSTFDLGTWWLSCRGQSTLDCKRQSWKYRCSQRYIHVSFSPCRRRHHVGKEYRAKNGRELRTEPYSIPAVRGQTEEERTLRIKRKQMEWMLPRCEGKKLIKGKGNIIGGLIVNPMESAWTASNSIPPLAKRVSQGNRQANLKLHSLLLMRTVFQYYRCFSVSKEVLLISLNSPYGALATVLAIQ